MRSRENGRVGLQRERTRGLPAYNELMIQFEIDHLQVFVEGHEAVNHPFLLDLGNTNCDRDRFRRFGLQHYQLVKHFTGYMEQLLINAPSSREKLWIAKVLVDEYGEGSDQKDHAELYREFLAAAGASRGEEDRISVHENVLAFIEEHQRIVREAPFLVALGSLGPGHEWAIPKMFAPIIDALRSTGFNESDIQYFTLHSEQDVDHGNWLKSAITSMATTSDHVEQLRHGAELSLNARYKFWSAMRDVVSGAGQSCGT